MASPSSLASSRLRLEPFAPEDEPALLALFNLRDVRRYLWDDRPVSRATVAETIAWSGEALQSNGLGHFTLRLDGEPDRVRGFAGLRPFSASEGEAGDDPERVEVLYALEPALWGRGLATEAARVLLSYGFDRLGLAEIYAGADPPNAASFRVMERLGMTFAFDTEIGGNPARYWRLRREDFSPPARG